MKIRNVILILLLLVCWQSGRAAGTDPNQIVFSVTFHHNYNVTNPIEQFRVFSGVPRYEAVLVTPLPGHDFVYVSDGGYKNAVWTPYDGIVKMPLGPMDGDYQVDFGLKGADDQPVWFGTIATLKRTAPQIFITNPANRTVATPYIQLQGYSTKELRSVTFDLSNAVAVATNQEGFLTGYHFDSVVQDFTINYCQCFDLPLTNGVNAISLHCTDLAGNVTTTNFNVTLDYSTAISPVLKITFPPNGLKISGGSFTLRGWTEDAVAQVTAQIVNTNGNTNVITGEVERDGKLWVENLPMSSGTNWLTLTVKNSAGLSSVTNLMLTKSDLVLTMNRVTDDLWRPTVNVTGYVSDTNDAVWVNGVKATVSGNGNWAASNVPVSKGGTAEVRFWKNGALMADLTDRITLGAASDVSDQTNLFTYWNGGAPATQSMYVDDVILTTDTPSAKDAAGHPYIGVGTTSGGSGTGITVVPQPPSSVTVN